MYEYEMQKREQEEKIPIDLGIVERKKNKIKLNKAGFFLCKVGESTTEF